MTSRGPAWSLIAVASGAAALGYETVWLRRLSLVLGGSATAAAWTLAVFMAGMGIGGWLAKRMRGRPAPIYAGLEAFAAVWALLFPSLLSVCPTEIAALLPLPATFALGATWPVLARGLPASDAVGLYSANAAGAVLGTLATTFVVLPALGVRGTECVCAGLGLIAALSALAVGSWDQPDARPPSRVRWSSAMAAAAAGFAALGLEIVWMRLAAVGLGSTVQTYGLVLAVFLATIAIGSAIGRTWPVDADRAASWGLGLLGLLALVGAATWPWVPYGLAAMYRWTGPEGLWFANLLLAAGWMAGAPAASGLAFAGLLRREAALTTGASASWLYAANALGSTLGALLTGLVFLPAVEPRGTVIGLALLCAVFAVPVARAARREAIALGALTVVAAILLPQWDARLYAVGVHLKISDFSDPSTANIARYASDNWELLHYDHGRTAAVAIGRSTRTGNIWLSLNGKFDASTGDDMPTQELSGELPVQISPSPARVAVVGLASGVTAGAVLRDPRVREMLVIELEPAVVTASHFFDHVNGRPLDDPRTTLRIQDARAVFEREETLYDVIISEPSNPWITGVSSLFTLEYWTVAKSRLSKDGVFCQWVQLYGMGPEEFRGLVRTYQHVFGDVWLYETIPGSDVLLVAGPAPPSDLPLHPTLDPAGVRRLAGTGWLNTDDHPRVEWEAPKWLHYDTAADNAALINASSR